MRSLFPVLPDEPEAEEDADAEASPSADAEASPTADATDDAPASDEDEERPATGSHQFDAIKEDAQRRAKDEEAETDEDRSRSDDDEEASTEEIEKIWSILEDME
jgi:hypothetical protein